MPECSAAFCVREAALTHDDKPYCVPHYRAHTGTPLTLGWHPSRTYRAVGIDATPKV